MKRIIMLLVSVFSLSTLTLRADNDKVIQFSELPAAARTFVQKHFPQAKVVLTKMDTDLFDKDYDVIFENGDKIAFDSKGNWKDIECALGNVVPTVIIPTQIQTYLKQNYPDATVKELGQDRNDYDIKLSTGIELKFDKQFRLIEID